jgi:hypothetical protein
MQNPIFLILIVKRNRDNSEVATKDFFNEGGPSDIKGSNDPRIINKNTIYSYNLNNDLPPDANGPQGITDS